MFCGYCGGDASRHNSIECEVKRLRARMHEMHVESLSVDMTEQLRDELARAERERLFDTLREDNTRLTRERDEALAALRGLFDSLFCCEHVDSNDVPDCTRVATRGYAGSDGGLCDGHGPEWMPDVRGADAIREAERVLGVRS